MSLSQKTSIDVGPPDRRRQQQAGAVVSTVQSMESVLNKARESRRRVLAAASNRMIIDAISQTAGRWLDPAFAPRQQALEILSERLRMARPMLARGFDLLFSALDRQALWELLRSEADPPQALERAISRLGPTPLRLGGPPVLFYCLAGNVPGQAVPAIVASLLARSVCILRDSTRQPLLTAAFVNTLAAEASDLAAMVIPTSWDQHGLCDIERVALAAAGRAEVYGSDRTVRELTARYGEQRTVAHGARLSIGLVPERADTDRWAAGFAEDISMYEGQGCLTPHAIIVEGPSWRAERMAKGLGLSLARLAKLWPRHAHSTEAEAERRAFLASAEMATLSEPGNKNLRGREDAWCVFVDQDAWPIVGPGLRCVTVIPSRDRVRTRELLGRAEQPLAGVGLGMDEQDPAYQAVRAMLEEHGATLVCKPGRMQAPPLAWQQDGRARLGDLLSWQAEEGL